MGYYSGMDVHLVVKREMEVAFSLAIERENNLNGELSASFLQYIYTENRSIAFCEYYGKWYNEEEFVIFLAPYVEEGKLLFTGEDGERWGYYFDGKGNVQFIYFVETVSDEYLLRKDKMAS